MRFKDYLIEKKSILDISLEDFLKNPIKGYEYSENSKEFVAQRDRKNRVSRLTDRFFKSDPENRKSILFHEIGHDLIQSPSDFNKYFKDVMEPFRVNKDKPISANSKYKDYFGMVMEDYPEEVIANGYMAFILGLYKGYDKDGDVYKFIAAIEKRARQLKLPTKITQF